MKNLTYVKSMNGEVKISDKRFHWSNLRDLAILCLYASKKYTGFYRQM